MLTAHSEIHAKVSPIQAYRMQNQSDFSCVQERNLEPPVQWCFGEINFGSELQLSIPCSVFEAALTFLHQTPFKAWRKSALQRAVDSPGSRKVARLLRLIILICSIRALCYSSLLSATFTEWYHIFVFTIIKALNMSQNWSWKDVFFFKELNSEQTLVRCLRPRA